MSNVTLHIGGRDYKVACAEGEEDHVTGLGRLIDAKLNAMGAGGQSESRTLLFAALLLADEVHELRTAATAPRPSRAPAASPDQLDLLAERLENVASHLEG